MKSKIAGTLLGLAIGDALGVPVEFTSRTALTQQPVMGMQGYGTHSQPAGTWSDDSSMAFCLAESLCLGYNLTDLANRFVNWYKHGYWTAHGQVFDIGIATSQAMHRLDTGISPLLSGGMRESDNGNGSLMRILPLVFTIHSLPINVRFQRVTEVSTLTHGHIRSVFACFLYCEYAILLINGAEKREALKSLQIIITRFLSELKVISEEELNRFHRILERPVGLHDVQALDKNEEAEIMSSGYVLHTLEASLWCFLTTDSYAEAVLKAVNLGSDTDTTGCVTGGLAGLYYGIEQIPTDWLQVLARRPDIDDLAARMAEVVNQA